MQVPVLWLPPVALTYFLVAASYVTVSSGQHDRSSGMSRRQPNTKAVWHGTHALALREVAFIVRDDNSGLLAVCASHPASKVVDLLLVAIVDQEVEVRAACRLIGPEDGVREVARVECRLVGTRVGVHVHWLGRDTVLRAAEHSGAQRHLPVVVIHEWSPRAVVSALARKPIALVTDHAVDALDVEATLHVCSSDSRAMVVVQVARLLDVTWSRPPCTTQCTPSGRRVAGEGAALREGAGALITMGRTASRHQRREAPARVAVSCQVSAEGGVPPYVAELFM
eukprot:scaffold22468_cov68-Phaeocystis_antarctica.AAC.3